VLKECAQALLGTLLLCNPGGRIIGASSIKIRWIEEALLYSVERLIWEGPSFIKEASNWARRAWITGHRVAPSTPLEVALNWNPGISQYLGRALPPKDELSCQKDLIDTLQESGTKRSVKMNAEVLERCSLKALNWYTPIKNVNPYSEASCIGSLRSEGGQAKLIQDLLYFFTITHDVYDNEYYDLIHEPDSPEKSQKLIVALFKDLDDFWLDHASECQGGDFCGNKDLHPPFRMEALPETGWRSRIVGIPWISMIFMTTGIQRSLLVGCKKDPVSSPILTRRYDGILNATKEKFVNSVDFKAATEFFPFEIGRATISKLPISRTERKYAMASFSSCRLKKVDSESFNFHAVMEKEIFSIETQMSDIMDSPFKDWNVSDKIQRMLYLPAIKKIVAQLDKECPLKKGGPRALNKFWGNWDYAIEENDTDILNNLINQVFMSMKDCHKRGTYNITSALAVVSGKTVQQQHEDFVAKQYMKLNKYRDAKIEVWERIKDRYMDLWFAFSDGEYTFSQKGQNMSLPLSWQVLSLFNTTCVDMSGCIGATLGDDALLGSDNLEKIVRYRELVEACGPVIHLQKDLISEHHRGVFGEHIFENGEWVDHPKIKVVLQPGVLDFRNRWIASTRAFMKNTAWWPNAKQLLSDFLMFTYGKEINEAYDLGLPVNKPEPFGLAIPFPDNDNSRRLSYLNKITDAEELLKEVQKWSSAYNASPHVVYRSYGRDILFNSGINFNLKGEGHLLYKVEEKIANVLLNLYLYDGYQTRDKKFITPKDVAKRIPDLSKYPISNVDYDFQHKNIRCTGLFVDQIMSEEGSLMDIHQLWRNY